MKLFFIMALAMGVQATAIAKVGSSIEKNIVSQYQKGFSKFYNELKNEEIQTVAKIATNQNTTEVVQLVNKQKNEKLPDFEESRPIAPERFNKGRYKLIREYTDSNDNFNYKTETICQGTLALPVFDVRSEMDHNYYYDFSQSLTCTGMLDGQFIRYFLGGVITYVKEQDPFAKGHQKIDLKVLAIHVYTENLGFPWPNNPDDPVSPNYNPFFSEWSSIASKDMNLKQVYMTAERSLNMQSCSTPINKPAQPIPPPIEGIEVNAVNTLDGDDNQEPTPPLCPVNSDYVHLTIEMND